jgi:hypothetical protein
MTIFQAGQEMKLSSGVLQTLEDEISTRAEICIRAENCEVLCFTRFLRSPGWVEILP